MCSFGPSCVLFLQKEDTDFSEFLAVDVNAYLEMQQKRRELERERVRGLEILAEEEFRRHQMKRARTAHTGVRERER